MIDKEIAEIRRRFRPEKNNITHIRGCYVNEKKEIISEFNQSLGMMPEEESEKMLAILKRTLSGSIDRNLINITFDTQQVVDSEEHKLLMALRSSSLNDAESVASLFQHVIETLVIEGNYLILLAHDTYDIPFRSSDGEKQEDASSEVFSYILCSICPVKMTKPALSYYVRENEFHNHIVNRVVAPPELGFMFPAFDDRSANIYNALYYTKDISKNHQEFVDILFKSEVPMPAAAQKEVFQAILEDTLADNCSYDVVQTVHEHLCELIEEHKINKEIEPLVITKDTVKVVLESCGVSEIQVSAFEEKYDTEFGIDTNLSPKNIVNVKQFEVSTPNVKIHVKPECSHLVETRVIDGTKYVLVRADENVEVNGVNVLIS